MIIIANLQVKDEDEDTELAKKDEKVKALFLRLAGEDGEVDWMELKEIMDYTMRNGMSSLALFSFLLLSKFTIPLNCVSFRKLSICVCG